MEMEVGGGGRDVGVCVRDGGGGSGAQPWAMNRRRRDPDP